MRRNPFITGLLVGAILVPQAAWAQGGTAAPAPATQPAAQPAATPGAPQRIDRPWTGEELDALKELETMDLPRYEAGQAEHIARMKVILRREYEQRLSGINAKYKKPCVDASKDSRARSDQSRVLLEEFLAKYPSDPAWTPDVMFRLAKLYYYQINAAWNEFSNPPCQAITGAPSLDVTPTSGLDIDGDGTFDGPDYTPSITLWRRIATEFKEYRLIDGTLYLLAYVTGEAPPFGMGRPNDAKPVWLGLVCKNKFDPMAPPAVPPDPTKLPPCPQPDPKYLAEDPYAGCEPYKPGSKLTDEAWVRIGDAHFNARCELPSAIAAYKQVAKNEQSEYYENALYMLAWGYYRFNQYEDAIANFDKFVLLSDKKEAEGEAQFDLRKEAVQYLAISLADPRPGEALSNPVKTVERANAFYKGRTGEKHVRDVYEELGTVIKTNAGTPTGEGALPEDMYVSYEKAIEVWRFSLDNWPLHPRNPIIHQWIVELLEYMGDKNAVVAERQKISELYKKGSPWYRANEMNREAMEAANSLSENSLIQAATEVHRRAQEERVAWEQGKTDEQLLTLQGDPGRKAYQALYLQAGDLYEQYLVAYPTSKNLYEFTYRLGDCYFYGDKFDDAVKQYVWVRDHGNMGTKYRDRSIKRIVEARRTAVDLALKANPPTLTDPVQPTVESLAQSQTAIAIPELWSKLQLGFDEYMTWVPQDPEASKLALSSAMISYKHLQLDDALKRFQVVFDKFCNTPEAVQAKDGLLVIYQARGENDKFTATNDKFISRKCGTADQLKLAEDQNKALAYKMAKRLFDEANEQEKNGQNAQEKFLEAGQAFYAYFMSVEDANPDKDDALFAAAVAFSRGGRPKTAISLYQIFLDKKEFRQSEYYVEAMFLIAKNYQNAFDYQKAGDMFLQVYKVAGEKGRKSQATFNLKQARLDALYNAALLREVDRAYVDRSKNDLGAISLYKQYANEETDPKKASDGYFRIALIYKKQGKTADMLAAFETWRNKHAKDPTLSPNIALNYVMSFYETARAKKTAKEQAVWWQKTIEAFDRVFNDAAAAKTTDPTAKAQYDKALILAREWAGEAQFRLADKFYREQFEPYKFKWLKLNINDPKKLAAAIDASYKQMDDLHEKTIRELLKVGRFQSTWGLAALERIGDVSYFAGDKILTAGLPKEIEKADQQFPDQNFAGQYTEQTEQLVRDKFWDPQDTKANPFGAKQYWLLTIETAKNAGISNEWSKLAQQRLNAFIASDLYPVQRDDLLDPEVKP